MELSAVRIFVTDVPAAARFYADVVRLKQVSVSPDVALFGSNPLIIIEAVGSGDDDHGLVGRFTGVSFATENASSLHDELIRCAVPTHGAPERQAWGGILLHADDPSGNTITFVQSPSPAAG